MPQPTRQIIRALRAAPSRGLRLAEFLFRRRDAGGDIYPHDPDHGTVAGPDPDRVLFLGERGELSLGVRTHELSLPYARRRSTTDGAGCRGRSLLWRRRASRTHPRRSWRERLS